MCECVCVCKEIKLFYCYRARACSTQSSASVSERVNERTTIIRRSCGARSARLIGARAQSSDTHALSRSLHVTELRLVHQRRARTLGLGP